MKPDEFEQDLRNQPLRPVPPSWRAEILREAKAGARTGTETQPSLSQAAEPWWREWLWPCPQVWAGLAAAWMVLIGLHLTQPARSSARSARAVLPTSETRLALAAQRRERGRLLDAPVETPPASKAAVPGPRSEREVPSKA